jgi:hypothetical protein
MKTAVVLLSLVLLAPLAAGAESEQAKTGFGFSLLPNGLTPNPTLSMTVNTVITDYGRELQPATGETVYFEAHDMGLQQQGVVISGERAPLPAVLRETLLRSLAASGYQPAPAGGQAQVALVYFWGSHHGMDWDIAVNFPDQAQQYILERAALIGGGKYQHQLSNEFDFGYTALDRTPAKVFLLNQAYADVYYVVVSAYDYCALAENQRRLLWRTTMTSATYGVSMKDALPPLVMTAQGYFGRETIELCTGRSGGAR